MDHFYSYFWCVGSLLLQVIQVLLSGYIAMALSTTALVKGLRGVFLL